MNEQKMNGRKLLSRNMDIALCIFRLFLLVSLLHLGSAFNGCEPKSSKNFFSNAACGPLFALPPRTPKRKARKGKSSKSQEFGPGSSLGDEELKEHVMKEYTYGSGGILRGATSKRDKMTPSFEKRGEDIRHLQMLDRHPALVLNADYQPISYLPLSMWHWQEAVKAVFSGKVTVVDVYPDVFIRAANIEVALPSVIALNEYVPQPNSKPAFTKRNVFLRDEYRCQYCGERFHTRDLSLDHVHPRSMGGVLNWENAVTSCRKCNGRKGSLTVNQLSRVGMRLLREPYVPTQYQLHTIAGRMLPRKLHPSWTPFLGFGEIAANAAESVQEERTENISFNQTEAIAESLS